MKTVFIFLFAILFFILFSCNHNNSSIGEGTPYTSGPITQTITATVPLVDTVNDNIFLIATGNTNDWFCEFYVYKIRFVYNNGKDSLIKKTDFSYDIQNNLILDPLTFKSKEDDFILEIKDESCNGKNSENIKEKKITIQLNKKIFNGCVREKINN